MNSSALHSFVHSIMDIKATTIGMGGASAGVLGMSAFGDRTTYDIKAKVIAFADGYRKTKPDKKAVTKTAQEIEGLLQGLTTLSVISEKTCESLTIDLQNLMADL
jgi:hypothetical protein